MGVKRGFTLVEILVVMTILGVLAAIVVPQYSSGKDQAKLACLCSNLHVIRRQIELYKTHHNGVLPAVPGDTKYDFARRMLTRTDAGGAAGTQFGPYLERLPINTFNNRCTVRVGDTPAGANTDGWRFNPLTGEFQADDNRDDNGDSIPDHARL
jgi:general secretion pathway protein G